MTLFVDLLRDEIQRLRRVEAAAKLVIDEATQGGEYECGFCDCMDTHLEDCSILALKAALEEGA